MGKKVKKEAEPPPKDVFDPLTVESKKVATVVLMLNSPEEEILAKACEAIYRFALKGEENKATLLELGAVEPLTKLLTHEDKIVRRNATMIFGILASNNDVKKLLRELDVVNSVIARLAPEEEVVIHEFASLCLANMSVEYTSKVQIFEQGGLEPLIRLLSSPDPDVKKNSIECIYNLVQDFRCRATLQELNAIPPILDLLKSEYPIIQLLALKTLGVITNDKASRAMLRENQGVDQLIKILETKELNDLHIEALSVVANCIEDMDTMVLIQQTGGLKKLLSFAENSTIPEIQKNAARAIAKAAYDQYIMRDAGLEEAQAGIKLARRKINNLRYADDTTLMAESEEKLKTLLMKVKEESEKVGLKLNIQKTKIMASGPITSWQIDGETVEAMTDFIFGGSKITADGDCSHEIKRRLLLGRKVMTNLDSILKSRDITLSTKVHLVQAMVFPLVMYGSESWTIKKAEH